MSRKESKGDKLKNLWTKYRVLWMVCVTVGLLAISYAVSTKEGFLFNMISSVLSAGAGITGVSCIWEITSKEQYYREIYQIFQIRQSMMES